MKQNEARALMAEEQLNSLNAYMAKATPAYQTEIMRLRKELSKKTKQEAAQNAKPAKPGQLASRHMPAGVEDLQVRVEQREHQAGIKAWTEAAAAAAGGLHDLEAAAASEIKPPS